LPIEIGSEVEGKISGIAKFGAFVELPEGAAGLIHVSQVANTFVDDIGKHLKVGDIVKVKVLGSAKPGKYDLSIKQVGQAAQAAWQPKRRAPRDDKSKPVAGTFEDKISKFLKQSEDKLVDWKRNLESKQGGGKKKH